MDTLFSNRNDPLKKADQIQKILTIDDDDLVRQSIVVFLEDCGYDVIEADCGEDGVRLFESEQPQLVLCDLRMPGMDGMKVLENITRISPDTPVIVISGAGLINDVVEALRLGAIDYLIKPISDLAVLEHAVEGAFSKQRLESENLRYKKELEDANNELRSHLNVLQQDLEAGRRAQVQLLPQPYTQLGAYEFSHTVVPSLDLSGDFLDYFEIDSRYIGFYVADVSGHGSASAFVTMMLKSLLNQPLRDYRVNRDDTILHPDRVLNFLNQELIKANLEKYVTLFFGVVDTHEHQLTYSIGGHFPRPLLIQGTQRRILQERGFPVGMFDWVNYESHSLSLEEPFSLVMFSDGVLECIKLKDGDFSESSLLELELEHHHQASDIVDLLSVRGLERLPDDVSILILRKRDHE
ncbi:SpoIIE family protein phosphatase [Pleionea sp. CnH1-48]|uniref:SpoIIE family protein phosphatase n=1 Tax=Pleionea sp. CnH1-48 TaxID=2954494 RepID=UPI0020975F70|nr:SpoIIE family protein phosphatase [Pleionea sp. CnH1-48]MCO7223605.1 SpoIIE family protein phosphatase [Pleionea sp. CnH1-48]